MRKRIVKKRKGSPESDEKLKRAKKEKKGEKKDRNPPLESQEKRGVAISPVSEECEPVDISLDVGDDGGEGDGDGSLNEARADRRDRIKLICGFTVVFSLFAAVAITCYAFAISHGRNSPQPDAEGESESETESGKIVFVKPYDDGSGVLSAPEIYETRRESVVTVELSYGEGLLGERGVCSGFIISDDGYIATAAHAVSGAESLCVINHDGKRYDARVVASDAESDLALLKIQAVGLKALELGGSDELLAGERVYSIGTPGSVDYAGSFFSGQVSYPLRTVTVYSSSGVVSKRLRLIQLDGKFNQGSSGSPIFDEYGRVVGIVSMRLSGDYSGVCFAVPSEGALRVLSAMMNGRELDSDVLSGVLSFAASLGIVSENGEENGAFGVRIVDFETDSSARGALKKGDLIIGVDNYEIRRESDLASAVGRKNRGEGAMVTVLRGGQRLTFEVTLG